jgi:hypothetical protein
MTSRSTCCMESSECFSNQFRHSVIFSSMHIVTASVSGCMSAVVMIVRFYKIGGQTCQRPPALSIVHCLDGTQADRSCQHYRASRLNMMRWLLRSTVDPSVVVRETPSTSSSSLHGWIYIKKHLTGIPWESHLTGACILISSFFLYDRSCSQFDCAPPHLRASLSPLRRTAYNHWRMVYRLIPTVPLKVKISPIGNDGA